MQDGVYYLVMGLAAKQVVDDIGAVSIKIQTSHNVAHATVHGHQQSRPAKQQRQIE